MPRLTQIAIEHMHIDHTDMSPNDHRTPCHHGHHVLWLIIMSLTVVDTGYIHTAILLLSGAIHPATILDEEFGLPATGVL